MTALKRKRQRRVNWKRWAVGFLLITVFLLGLGLAGREVSRSLWNGRDRFGWVSQDRDLTVIVIKPSERRGIKYLLPGNTLVKVSFGLSDYRLNKVYELGKLEQKEGKLLTRTVQALLGVNIKGWQVGKKTNLSCWDQLRLKLWLKLSGQKIKTVKLEETGALDKKKLSDGTEVFSVNRLVLDQLVHQEMFETAISQEGLSVAIVNCTSVEGEANEVSRLVTNLGAEVRWLGNGASQEKSSILVAKPELSKSETVKALVAALGISSVRTADVAEYRSDVAVIVGQDYTTW